MDTHPPPATIPTVVLLIIAVILLFLSMIFSSSESAFLSVNRLRVRFLKEKRHPRAIRTLKLLQNKERLINTLLVANNIVNIALSALVTTMTIKIFGNAGVAIATFIVTVALLLFSEITPKTIASRHPEPVAFFVSGFVLFLEWILSPLIYVFTLFSRIVLHCFGVKPPPTNQTFSEEEIKTFIDLGQETGVIEDNEKRLMHSVFKFTDLLAKDIMIPRPKIVAVSIDTTYEQVVSLARKTKLSRFPVFRGDIDHIEGLLYLKDLLLNCNEKTFDACNFMRPPLFILGTKKMSLIQQVLRENHQSIAVVVDEYSGTEGILTSEDIQRQIFGTITDDTYKAEDYISIEQLPLTILGTTRLLDLEDSLKISFDCTSETIGGFIATKLDRIPELDDKVIFKGFEFTVVSMQKLTVETVNIRLLS